MVVSEKNTREDVDMYQGCLRCAAQECRSPLLVFLHQSKIAVDLLIARPESHTDAVHLLDYQW